MSSCLSVGSWLSPFTPSGLCSRPTGSSGAWLWLCASAVTLCCRLCANFFSGLSLTILQWRIFFLTTCCTMSSTFPQLQILHCCVFSAWSSVAPSTLRLHLFFSFPFSFFERLERWINWALEESRGWIRPYVLQLKDRNEHSHNPLFDCMWSLNIHFNVHNPLTLLRPLLSLGSFSTIETLTLDTSVVSSYCRSAFFNATAAGNWITNLLVIMGLGIRCVWM